MLLASGTKFQEKKLTRSKEGRLEWPPLNVALLSELDLSSANLSIKGVTGPHISTTSTMSLNLGPHIEGKYRFTFVVNIYELNRCECDRLFYHLKKNSHK